MGEVERPLKRMSKGGSNMPKIHTFMQLHTTLRLLLASDNVGIHFTRGM